MNYNNIPRELTELNQWVCCYKNSKIPMQANEISSATSIDSSTWSSFEDAKDSVELFCNYDNIGFVFNNNGIVGIDIDKGFEDNKETTPLLKDIMEACHSYTEISRSGRGVHIYLKGELPFKGKNNRNGVEIYQASRYFIVTGDVFKYSKVVENQEAINYILEKYFPEELKENVGFKKEVIYKPIYRKPESGRIQITPTYPIIPDGMRNLSLTSLGGQLHSLGYTKRQLYLELCKVNKIACKPPLKENEIEMICNSISRYRR